MAKTPPTISERFWAKVAFGFGPNACWTWKAGTTLAGYGVFQISKRPHVLTYAHRYVLALVGREGEVTHHLCSNTLCVNPAHLEPKTHADHMRQHALLRQRDALGRFG